MNVAIHTVSLFSGVCGLDLGIDLAVGPVQPLCYVEREIAAAEIIAARMCDGSLGRKAEACERCKAGLLLADGESLRQFSNRQCCKMAGCKRQGQRSAIVEAPVRHPSVLESSNAPTGNEGQVDQFASVACSGCSGSGACACACPPPQAA